MTTTVEKMKRAILAHVAANDRCTFVDLVAAIPDAKGEYVHELPGRNVVLWGGLSDEAATACSELFFGHRIFYVPANSLVPFIAAGEILTLPIARSPRQIEKGYDAAHWLPVLLTCHHPFPERAAADFAAWARVDAARAAKAEAAHVPR